MFREIFKELKMPTFNVKAHIDIPRPPNFLRLSDSDQAMSIADFTDEGLEEIGRQWTENLIKSAQEKRKLGKIDG